MRSTARECTGCGSRRAEATTPAAPTKFSQGARTSAPRLKQPSANVGGKDMSSALATIRRSAPLAMGPDEALTSDAFFAQLEQDHPVKVHAPCMRDLPRPSAPVEGRAGALHTVRVTDPRTCQRPPAAPRCRAARVQAMRVGFPCMVARRGSGALRKHFHVQTADGGVGNRGPGD